MRACSAVAVHADVQQGDAVLVTGIGGGVATLVLQLCLARGATVYVTSSNDSKIARAITLGARGGVNYTAREPSPLSSLHFSAGSDQRTGLTSSTLCCAKR